MVSLSKDNTVGGEAMDCTEQMIQWIECSLIFDGREAEFARLSGKLGSVDEVLAAAGRTEKAINVCAQRILSSCGDDGIQIITQADAGFPGSFFETIPPVLIYAKGDTKILSSTHSVGIIGARRASRYSLGICERFASALADKAVVVSGFAAGTDQCAHKACIDAHGKTIAVLGCGIGHDYPSGSLELQREIAAHGLVISEFAPKTKPVPENFTRRNRLISALSQKLLVIEASDTSGCLNTVNHALQQGREVYVIPPNDICSRRYAGQCSLIRDGANIAFQPCDL